MTITILGANDIKIQVNKDTNIDYMMSIFKDNIDLLKNKYSDNISGIIINKKINDHIINQLYEFFNPECENNYKCDQTKFLSKLVTEINSRNLNSNGYDQILHIINKNKLTNPLINAIKKNMEKNKLQYKNELYENITNIAKYIKSKKISNLLDNLYNEIENVPNVNIYNKIEETSTLNEIFLAVDNVIKINDSIKNNLNNIYSIILLLTNEIVNNI